CPGGCPKKAFDATGGCFPAGCWKGRIGHDLPVIFSPKPSTKNPVAAETCRTTYGRTSASAVIRMQLSAQPQCDGYLPLDRQVRRS
ncbi:hypothetical protein, partial [Thauera terpenica]|uniref:hypothetical protein n=1 Tax=Thauera terpenica TaxID=76113 RepID=UPI001C3F2C6F